MLKKERKYGFRERMLEVHQKNLRDFSAMPKDNEYEIK